jgi:glycosyltransferase involved in cell wall biosynthesis
VKVSLVATVKDAKAHVEAFLASIRAQTRPPDEVVIVDGGSRDGTPEILRRAADVTLVQEPGANIARGRNVAIRAAAHDVIAVSDGDCVLEPDWLERLLEPLEGGADVSMGFYRPIAETFLERCMAAANLPDADEVDPARFMPSSRSVAFRRDAFDAAGGYPEWLDIGEDMYLDHRWRQLGLDMRFAPRAVAWWRSGSPDARNWRRYFRYARGDALAGMYPERHALRFAVYGGAAYAWSTRSTVLRLLTFAGALAYAARPVRRIVRRAPTPRERAAGAIVVPGVLAFLDAAKMAGYVAGLVARRRGA